MKIAVMAAGGVGGYFGARLAAAGHDVTFIARGEHLDAIHRTGLRIKSPLGNVHLRPGHATSDPASIGPVDAVIFAVKLGDMKKAAEACRLLLGPDTAVVPFLNGVDAPGVLADTLGAYHACGGVAYISAHIDEPGVIRHVGNFARLIFGEMDGRHSGRLEGLRKALADSGVEAAVSTQIEVVLWEKFTVLVALSGTTGAARSAIGPLRASEIGRDVFSAAMAEVMAVGRAMGIPLGDDLMARQLKFFNEMPETMKASMLVDLEAGKPLEAPWLSGSVARLGREAGVPTPVNDALYLAVLPYIDGRLVK
ncbi:MAG: ketopantoate reductase family protein [Rhodospirillaceae bacterium]